MTEDENYAKFKRILADYVGGFACPAGRSMTPPTIESMRADADFIRNASIPGLSDDARNAFAEQVHSLASNIEREERGMKANTLLSRLFHPHSYSDGGAHARHEIGRKLIQLIEEEIERA